MISQTGILIIGLALLAPLVQARDVGVLVLPNDRARRDALEESGASTSELTGLSMLELPDSTTYYVIDRNEALRDRISARFLDVYAHDSDISVGAGPLYREFTHLRLGIQVPEAIRFEFETGLMFHVPELTESKPNSLSGGSIPYREYRVPIVDCDGLASRVDGLKTALRESVASIGDRTSTGRRTAEGVEEIVVDGAYYDVTLRFNGFVTAAVGVSENDLRLYRPLMSVLDAIEQCSKRAPAQVRGYEL
jgi:hypothetical protein